MPRLRPLAIVVLILLAAATHAGAPKTDWNDTGIGWLDFDAGMDRIQMTGKPGILVSGHLDTVHPIGTLEKNPWRVEDPSAPVARASAT